MKANNIFYKSCFYSIYHNLNSFPQRLEGYSNDITQNQIKESLNWLDCPINENLAFSYLLGCFNDFENLSETRFIETEKGKFLRNQIPEIISLEIEILAFG